MSCTIFHLAEPDDAKGLASTGIYRAPSLDAEGFIHCADHAQLPGVIQRYYAHATDLILLSIDSQKLGEKLVMENTVGGEELFPHVYSAIDANAIVDQTRLDSDALRSIAAMDKYDSSSL